ncbi:extracellular solute-binding protein [bacterium]|nr:MAG: extracellular solute-binding protein [bacterium]
MKTLLALILAALLGFTAVVLGTSPKTDLKGRKPVVWVTDPNPLRKEQVEAFNRLHPDLFLSIDPGNGGKEKVIVQSLAGVGPDAFDFWGEVDFDAYIRSGVAYDLTDDLKRRGIDYKKEVWPLALPWTVRNGRVYAIPANVGTDAIWLHRDMFEEAGVPVPKDGWMLEEFIETAKRMTERDAKGRVTRYGVVMNFNGGYLEWLPSFGGDIWSKDGRKTSVDSPESIACLTFIRDLIYKHKVSPSPAEEQGINTGGGWGGGAGAQVYFRKRIGAMALGGRWWLAQLRDDIRDRKFELGSVTPPIANYPRFGSGGARAVMVNASSPNREAAVEFAIYLLGETYNLLLNDQADALAGVKRYAYEPRYLTPPKTPKETFHAPFRKTLEMGVPDHPSIYLPRGEVDLYLNRQLDLVKLGQKEPAAALKDAARDIDAAMHRYLDRHPALKEKYEGQP